MRGMIRFSSHWSIWLEKILDLLPAFTTTAAVRKCDVNCEPGKVRNGSPFPIEASHSSVDKNVNLSITPIEWLATLPRDMSLVIYIDQPSCQMMEIVAMSRKQAAEYLRTPIYTDEQTRWQALGHQRLRRLDFSPALAFQQQEDALNALEVLESARYHASSHLADLDNEIHHAFQALIAPLTTAAQADEQTFTPQILSDFLALLASRKVTSAELARIDEEGIPALQKLGMPVPEAIRLSKQEEPPQKCAPLS